MKQQTLGIFSLSAVLLIAGCSASAESVPELKVPEKHTVRYEVTSSNGKARYGSVADGINANVTMTTPTGNVQATPDVPMKRDTGDPVEYEFSSGEFVYISAQNNGYYGDITCSIIVDGVTISENTSSGQHAIATCKGNA